MPTQQLTQATLVNIIQPIGAAQPSAPAPQPQATATTLDKEQKRAIATYIDEMASMYAYCLETAQNKIGASSDSETVRCMVSTLFIQASRKFNL